MGCVKVKCSFHKKWEQYEKQKIPYELVKKLVIFGVTFLQQAFDQLNDVCSVYKFALN